MKSKLLINIITIFSAFLVITALYFGVFIKQKIDMVRTLNRQKKVMMLRKTELVESRLALVGLANSRVSDSGFYESFSADMKKVEEDLQVSRDYVGGEDDELIDEELMNEEREVRSLVEDIYAQVQESFGLYSKLLEYDIAKDLSGPLTDEDYEDLLGRVISTMEGLEQFTDDSYLGQDVQLAISELALSELEIAVLNYNLLKIKAFKKVQEPIRSEQGVDMLVRLTNLVVAYEGGVADIAQSRQEIINSIPAGSGLLSIFNVE